MGHFPEGCDVFAMGADGDEDENAEDNGEATGEYYMDDWGDWQCMGDHWDHSWMMSLPNKEMMTASIKVETTTEVAHSFRYNLPSLVRNEIHRRLLLWSRRLHSCCWLLTEQHRQLGPRHTTTKRRRSSLSDSSH